MRTAAEIDANKFGTVASNESGLLHDWQVQAGDTTTVTDAADYNPPIDLTSLMSGSFTTSQSSTYGGGADDSGLVHDDNDSSFNHTLNTSDEWLLMEFDQSLDVAYIEVVNRPGWGSRLNGTTVSVLDDQGAVIQTFDPIAGASSGEVFTFMLPQITQVAAVRLDQDTNFLHIAELNVFGNAPSGVTVDPALLNTDMTVHNGATVFDTTPVIDQSPDNDTIDAGHGHDTAYGGWGNDEIRGAQGNDIIDGGIGNDHLYGHGGNIAEDSPFAATHAISLNQDAKNQYLLAENYAGLSGANSTRTHTIEFLVSGLASGYQALMSFANNQSTNAMIIEIDNGGILDLNYRGSGLDTGIDVSALQDGAEHRFSISWDGTSDTGEFIIYIDGAEVGRGTHSRQEWQLDDGTLIFGQEQDTTGGGFSSSQVLNGSIGDIRIFNDIRTAQEIADNANTPIADPAGEQGLVSNWQADANSITNQAVADTAGGTNLTVRGFSTASQQTLNANIDGINLNADYANNQSLRVTDYDGLAGGAFTVEMMVLLGPNVSNSATLMAYGPSYAIELEFISSRLQVTVPGNAGRYDSGITFVSLDDDQPHRISMSYESTSGAIALYVDGVLASSGTYTPGAVIAAGGPLAFGHDLNSSGNPGSWGDDVTIGDVRVFNDIRTAQEIADNAAAPIADPAGEQGLINNWQVDGTSIANGILADAVGGTGLTIGGEATAPTLSLVGAWDDDILNGGDGDDLLEGGAGNDTLDGGDDTDTASYATDTTGVQVDLTLLADQATGLDVGTDQLISIENLLGGSAADILKGDTNANIIEGGDGDDDLDGGGGTDTVTYQGALAGVTVDLSLTTAQDTVGAGIDTLANFENLTGSAHDDNLKGDANANIINGEAGNDIIEGGDGDDDLDGGADDDTLTYASATAGVTVDLSLTTAQDTVGAGIDTITNFENLTGSAFNDTLTGDANANIIEGGDGDDALDGGGGTDTVSYANASAGVTVNLSQTGPQDTIGAGFDTLANFENLTGSSFGDTLIGDANANIIVGGDGDDDLDGEAGNDTVSYVTASAGVTVDLSQTGPQDTIGAGIVTLANFENLTGSSFDDTLTGDTNANTIDGGAGDDALDGDGGTDTVSYASAMAGVTVDLSQTGPQDTIGAGIDTLANFENLTGSAHDDNLKGDANANVIKGGAGNDVIEGGDGDDDLDGGADDDTLTYVSASAGVTVDLSHTGPQDTIGAGIDTLANFENLTGSGHDDNLNGDANANIIDGGDGSDALDGGDGDDVLDGGDGADVLFGRDGADELRGGAGQDKLYVDNDDTVIDGGAGIDRLYVRDDAGGNLTGLGTSNIERFYGASLDDLIDATGATDNLYFSGGDGNDELIGGEGADQIFGRNDNDILRGNGGADKLYGDAGADEFYGGADNDRLFVDADDTVLDGGAGDNDQLYVRDPGGVNFDDSFMTISNIEKFYGGSGNDSFNLSNSAHEMRFSGGDGDDDITGGSARDRIYGRNDNDTLHGHGGDDNLYGDAGNDKLYGDDGNDKLYGSAGVDEFYGGIGNDQFFIDADDSIFDGGDGDDRVYIRDNGGVSLANLGGTDVERFYGNSGVDILNGAGATYSLILDGGSNNDLLTAGDAGDYLYGRSGDDMLTVGAGYDRLSGNGGADTFVFIDGTGNDKILDWEGGVDALDFSGVTLVDEMGDLTIGYGSSSITITYDDGSGNVNLQMITAEAPDTLTSDDFIFA